MNKLSPKKNIALTIIGVIILVTSVFKIDNHLKYSKLEEKLVANDCFYEMSKMIPVHFAWLPDTVKIWYACSVVINVNQAEMILSDDELRVALDRWEGWIYYDNNRSRTVDSYESYCEAKKWIKEQREWLRELSTNDINKTNIQ